MSNGSLIIGFFLLIFSFKILLCLICINHYASNWGFSTDQISHGPHLCRIHSLMDTINSKEIKTNYVVVKVIQVLIETRRIGRKEDYNPLKKFELDNL